MWKKNEPKKRTKGRSTLRASSKRTTKCLRWWLTTTSTVITKTATLSSRSWSSLIQGTMGLWASKMTAFSSLTTRQATRRAHSIILEWTRQRNPKTFWMMMLSTKTSPATTRMSKQPRSSEWAREAPKSTTWTSERSEAPKSLTQRRATTTRAFKTIGTASLP